MPKYTRLKDRPDFDPEHKKVVPISISMLSQYLMKNKEKFVYEQPIQTIISGIDAKTRVINSSLEVVDYEKLIECIKDWERAPRSMK